MLCLLAASLTSAVAQAESRITGRVEDGTGAGVAAAVVEISNPTVLWPAATARTDAEGNFALASLPPGKYKLMVGSPGFKIFTLHDVPLVDGATLALPVINLFVASMCGTSYTPEGIRLAPAGAPTPLVGRFIDPKAQGRALGGVTITLKPVLTPNALATIVETKVDGSFRVSKLPPRDYELIAEKRGYYPTRVEITVLQGYLADPYQLGLERCPTAACRPQDRRVNICE